MILFSLLLSIVQFWLLHKLCLWYGLPEDQAAEIAFLLAGIIFIETMREEFTRARPSPRRIPSKTREIRSRLRDQQSHMQYLCNHKIERK